MSRELRARGFRVISQQGGVALPPLAEQRVILQRLTAAVGRVDTMMVKVREAIDCLKELRTSLISAAVTGKIDVRQEAA